jgi:tRNA dimethylallyltransferase
MSNARPPLAVIAGPTASGKSALALSLAERCGGVIINADSAQLYAGTPILTAAPTPAEQGRAEHRLYGVRDASTPCSAAEWAGLAKADVDRAHRNRRLPILVGGTGLYLRSLIEGIAPVPPIDPGIRADVRAASVADNYAELTSLDPVGAARLNPGDSARVARALEVFLSTGKTLGEWQDQRSGGIGSKVRLLPLILLPPRVWLLARCEHRLEAMIASGALDEVRALLDRRLDPALPAMKAIGVAELGAYLNGQTTLEHAIAAAQVATRQYAKRQYTWFAHQPPRDWPRFTEPLETAGAKDEALALLGVPA